MTNPSGNTSGDRSVDDADGVKIWLLRDGAVVDSTLSQDGGFAFRVVLGTYLAFARIGASVADSTEQLHLHDADRVFASTIELGSSAELATTPNPFVFSVALRYVLPVAGTVRLQVLSLAGAPIRTLVAEAQAPGLQTRTWDGTNDASQSVAPGIYWITLDHGNTHYADLLFRDGVPVRGHVRLIANLFAGLGADSGRRVIEDAYGVRVHLSKPAGGQDSTETESGGYAFAATAQGSYHAAAWVVPSMPSTTPDFVVSQSAVSVADTLELGPVGALKTYPNPFPSAHGLAIEFDLARATTYTVSVLALDGAQAYIKTEAGAMGLNHFHWPGWDNNNNPVPYGPYWVIVKADGQERYNLAFKE